MFNCGWQLWGNPDDFGSNGWKGDDARFKQTYFDKLLQPDAFCQGDVAMRGSDGQFYLTGRSDDVMNINGIRSPACTVCS